MRILLSSLLLLLLMAGCDVPVAPAGESGKTPRLQDGPHIDFIVGFDALDAERSARADSLTRVAVDQGMRTSRIQVDWSDLEPEPGRYDREALVEPLVSASTMGRSVFVTLSTLDTGELTIPSDLMTVDGRRAADGLKLDGPEIGARFEDLLDWLIPALAAHNVWGLSIANEPFTNEGEMTSDEMSGFLTRGADYARSLDPDLAVTVTLSGSTSRAHDAFTATVMAHLDVAMFNIYCLSSIDLLATGEREWLKDLDERIRAAAGRDVFFQELGCPAGYGDRGDASPPDEVLGSSQEKQKEFLAFMITQILENDQLRGASVFQLFDWSPELTTFYVETILAEEPGSEMVVTILDEWLTTVGLCRWAEKGCRAAWDVFVGGTAMAAELRSGE